MKYLRALIPASPIRHDSRLIVVNDDKFLPI